MTFRLTWILVLQYYTLLATYFDPSYPSEVVPGGGLSLLHVSRTTRMHPLSICVLFIPHILVRLLPMEYVEDSKFTPCNSRSTYTRLCRVRPVRLVLQDFIESILSEMILRDSVESVQSDLHYPTSPCSSQLGNSSCPAHSTGYPWNAPFGNPPIFEARSNAFAGDLANATLGTTGDNFPIVGAPATSAGFSRASIPASTGDVSPPL